jgi:hypothetical protein
MLPKRPGKARLHANSATYNCFAFLHPPLHRSKDLFTMTKILKILFVLVLLCTNVWGIVAGLILLGVFGSGIFRR